jgi:signal transduction histidine kinase
MLDLKELSNFLVNSLGESLNLMSCSLLVWNEKKGRYVLASSYGLNVQQALRCELEPTNDLVKLILERREAVDKENVLPGLTWQEASRLERSFDLLQCSLVFPLFDLNQSLVGLVAVCKRFKSALSREEETRIYTDMLSLASVAISNALSFEKVKQDMAELKQVQLKHLHSPKLSALEQLAGGIAHEIHNPLTVISGRAQILLLRKSNNLDPKVEDVLKTIVTQTKRAAEITRKLILFSQESHGQKEWLSFEGVIDDTIALLSYRMNLDQIQIKKRIDPSAPLFMADITEMRELFLNLLLNSVRAIGKQGVITVIVRYKEEEARWEIKVADTGCGIPKENFEKLFDPFFSTHHEAVGLGLYIVQQILKHYDGYIDIDSELNKGTVVKIELPQQTSETVSRPTIIPIHQESPSSVQSSVS